MPRYLAIVLVLVAAVALTAASPGPAASDAVNRIEGTWELVRRDLPDGGVLHPPTVIGLLTFTRDRRNFNVYWTDAQGRRFSIGAIAEYTLTDDAYTERNVLYVVNDEISGAGLTYDVSSAAASSTVTRTADGIAFDLPLHSEPHVVFTDDGFTATREGEFIDHWRRIR